MEAQLYQDIVYMRFMKQGKVVRVARADTHRGLVLALYPTENRDLFQGEAFREVDDPSRREPIARAKIKDKVWLKLLDGRTHKDAVRGYKATGIGYSYSDNLRSREFRIAEDIEEN